MFYSKYWVELCLSVQLVDHDYLNRLYQSSDLARKKHESDVLMKPVSARSLTSIYISTCRNKDGNNPDTNHIKAHAIFISN